MGNVAGSSAPCRRTASTWRSGSVTSTTRRPLPVRGRDRIDRDVDGARTHPARRGSSEPTPVERDEDPARFHGRGSASATVSPSVHEPQPSPSKQDPKGRPRSRRSGSGLPRRRTRRPRRRGTRISAACPSQSSGCGTAESSTAVESSVRSGRVVGAIARDAATRASGSLRSPGAAARGDQREPSADNARPSAWRDYIRTSRRRRSEGDPPGRRTWRPRTLPRAVHLERAEAVLDDVLGRDLDDPVSIDGVIGGHREPRRRSCRRSRHSPAGRDGPRGTTRRADRSRPGRSRG